MIEIEINVDTSRIKRVLTDFPARITAAKMRILRYVGQAVASRATQSFRTASFRPSRWAPRKDKKAKHPLLIRSGNLRQSITWRFKSNDTVVAGTSTKYARYHQMGTKHMPARPFFPVDAQGRLTDSMLKKINRNVDRICKDELGKLRG